MKILRQVNFTPEMVVKDGVNIGSYTLGSLYRERVGNYPKFFKMDGLCKLAFLGAELLLDGLSLEEKENIAIILFNRSGSLTTDRNYQKTLSEDNYFPSPALFVYTLANIATGEIAIRHKIYGETSFYIMESPDDAEMTSIIESTFQTSNPEFILTGGIEYDNESDFIADMKLITK